MTEPREVEAKFEASPDVLDRLLSLQQFGDFTLQAFPPKEQNDLYYDTAAGHLREAGSSLRIRRKGDVAVMTFKGKREAVGDEGNTVSRLEDEVDLPADRIEGLSEDAPLALTPEPSPLKRARALSGSEPLRSIARLLTTRTVMLARSTSGVEIELAIDRCKAERLQDGRLTEFVEVEAELKQGVVQELHQATRQLGATLPGLRPSTRTKLERALD